VTFEGRIHEQVAPSIRRSGGIIIRSDVTIRHLGYAEPSAEKRVRNLALLRLELAECPDDAFTLFNLGLSLQADGNWTAATRALERSLASGVRPLTQELRAVAWTKLAEARLAGAQWVDAARAAERALMEDPALNLARYALGRALFEQGELDRAATLFDRLRDAAPDALGMTLHPRLVAQARALVSLRQQRWADAASAILPVATDDPTGEAQFLLGNAYLGLGRLEEAARAYEAARASGFASPHLDRRLALCRCLSEGRGPCQAPPGTARYRLHGYQ
jgi:tetratricopeptide (TPR) repeat protein